MTTASDHIFSAIGNTPLVKLKNVVPSGAADVFIKLESFNPTGSYKDRMAHAIISEAEIRGDLKQGMTVIEYTGGSTGTSLAFICALKGYAFHVISSDAFATEKLRTMKVFGAELELISSEGGLITPSLFQQMLARIKELDQDPSTYWTRQFENTDAITGYRKIGAEIIQQLDNRVDCFCAAVGTAGMFAGVTIELNNQHCNTLNIIAEPASAPLLLTGTGGSHTVEGISVGIVPPLLSHTSYDKVLPVDESSARIMAKRLASEEGILAGTSTGLNVVAAIQMALSMGKGHTVVTVACDSGLKYLSGTLFGEKT